MTTPSWKIHDMRRPAPADVAPGSSKAFASPPSDARILFDGNGLEAWRSGDGPPRWQVRDEAIEVVPGAGDIHSVDSFGDVQLHLEWQSPAAAEGAGQNRGNSGIFLMDHYEVQVLDCHLNPTYADGVTAALYGQIPPLVNACDRPGVWQAFDIVFRRPRFDASGGVLRPARMTILLNGILVQDNASLWGPTNWLEPDPYQPHADSLPLRLQDHGSVVRFRNIWIRDLPSLPESTGNVLASTDAIELSSDAKQRFVGAYGVDGAKACAIEFDQQQLQIELFDRRFDLVTVDETRFALRRTDAEVEFAFGPDDRPTGLTFRIGGEERVMYRL